VYGFLLVFFNNFVPKTHHCKYTVTLKPGLGDSQGHRNDTSISGTHNFLLPFYSNHRPISQDLPR